ncbi:DNA topoisomerase IV, alpha subunit [Rhizophagus irregularis]|uniref:DNA topoisomerase (ATP-hydrolyzing) n=3 Tax=Rhizophagus irregularis TaxID=588596 RepID=A0A2N0PWZ7_9GLOM|nr:DNA topoisomerase IV, alpha subunit [Rhizophagus irregularis]
MEITKERRVNKVNNTFNDFLETTTWVIQKIESMIERLLFDIAKKRPPVINSVSNIKRKENHSRYDAQNGIIRRKNNNLSNKQIQFLSTKNPKTFVIMIRILDICHELLIQNVTATKRDIYYKDVKLFGNSQTVDLVIDELACFFQIPRSCLNVIASAKGLVAGSLKIIQKDRSILDCSKTSCQATFQYILSSKMHEQFGPCILITGKGYPDIATRQLVKNLSDLRRPDETYPFLQILGFFDNDPYGIEILCVYKFGSLTMSFDNENLATPGIKWLGLHCSDWKKISKSSLIRISSADRKKAYHLLQRNYLQAEWKKEICLILYMGYKAEIQSLDDCENTIKKASRLGIDRQNDIINTLVLLT